MRVKNFIGYTLSAEGNISFRTSNPSTGERSVLEFFEATSEEADRAVELAHLSFDEFNALLPQKRADFLIAISEEIEILGDQLIEAYCFESGLSAERAVTEKKRTLFQLRSFASALVQGDWLEASIDFADQDNDPPKPDLRKMMTGIGPVVVFGASNFPLAYSTAGGDTASALAAGCPVIIKSHPLHAGTGFLVAEAIIKAAKRTNMPDGVFSNLNSSDFSIGRQLVLQPKVKAVGFTGSVAGGRALFDLAASRKEPIPVFAEMGSTNPVVILSSALKDETEHISTVLSSSITTAAGQFCTKPGILFIEESEYSDTFIQQLGSKIISSTAHVMLHTSIQERYEIGRKTALAKEHLELFKNDSRDEVPVGRQTLMVVDSSAYMKEETLRNEVFGPFALVVRCKDQKEIIRCLKLVEGSLTASLFTNSGTCNEELYKILKNKAGRLIFNGVPTGVAVCPSMNHGGPYPATTDSRFTAVGIDAMKRFLRPLTFQNFPQEFLPIVLRDENVLGITRRVNGIKE
jgi:NADP-dependent aldehyde dehydrogenase